MLLAQQGGGMGWGTGRLKDLQPLEHAACEVCSPRPDWYDVLPPVALKLDSPDSSERRNSIKGISPVIIEFGSRF